MSVRQGIVFITFVVLSKLLRLGCEYLCIMGATDLTKVDAILLWEYQCIMGATDLTKIDTILLQRLHICFGSSCSPLPVLIGMLW